MLKKLQEKWDDILNYLKKELRLIYSENQILNIRSDIIWQLLRIE